MRGRIRMLVVCGAALGCAATQPRWHLMQPPEVPNAQFPRGVQLVTQAPATRWRTVATFASQAACEDARLAQTNAAIDTARATDGDAATTNVAVRRAVNARCAVDVAR